MTTSDQPNDAELERMLVNTQRRFAGRIDIDRDEWIAVLALLRDTRAQLFAMRAAGIREPVDHGAVPPSTKIDALIREADRLRQLCDQHISTIVERGDMIATLRRNLADMSRAFDAEVERRIEREQRIATIEAETIMRVVSHLENLVEDHRVRSIDLGNRHREIDMHHGIALREAAIGVARGDWKEKP